MIDEKDAKLLARKIVERLRALGGRPVRFGVALETEGMYFTAELNGRQVTVQTGQGSFTYEWVAKELLARSLEPVDWGDQFYKIQEPGKLPRFLTH